VVEILQRLQHQPLHDEAKERDHHRGDQQRAPIRDAEMIKENPGGECAEHVLGAVGEVHHVHQAEDDRQSHAEHGVERAVDQADQELPEQELGGDVRHPRHTPR
jgi:hypothetical protein